MGTEHREDRDTLRPPGRGRFAWRGLVLWMPAAVVFGGLTAWLAMIARTYREPLVIFPLLVGVVLGAMLVGLMRLGHIGHRPTVLFGTVLAVAVTVPGQHYAVYYKAYHLPSNGPKIQPDSGLDISRLAEQFRPDFAQFMQNSAAKGRRMVWGYVAIGWVAWVSWAADGLLVLAAALAMVVPAVRLPYCNRCRTWYRVIRSGRIDVPTARRLAELTDLPTVDRATAARYRLLHCSGGCGPTDFDLSWDESPRGTSSVRAWLDADCRNRVVEVLDEYHV